MSIGLSCGLVLSYCLYAKHREVHLTARTASLLSNLGEIRQAAILYREQSGDYPATPTVLGLTAETFLDPVLNKPLRWMVPSATGSDSAVLVEQVAPYRSAPWPFGEMKQYRLGTDGEITEIRR